MKEWNISFTYLDTIQVPDDWTYNDVMEWAKLMQLARGCNDIEIFEVERSITDD